MATKNYREYLRGQEIWIKKYPHMDRAHGPAYTGISNLRLETEALMRPPVDFKKLPFDPLEFIDQLDDLPFDPSGDPGVGGG